MDIKEVRKQVTNILGEPHFNGERTWVWQCPQCEFAICVNRNNSYQIFVQIFVFLGEQCSTLSFMYKEPKDVIASAKIYSKYFNEESTEEVLYYGTH